MSKNGVSIVKKHREFKKDEHLANLEEGQKVRVIALYDHDGAEMSGVFEGRVTHNDRDGKSICIEDPYTGSNIFDYDAIVEDITGYEGLARIAATGEQPVILFLTRDEISGLHEHIGKTTLGDMETTHVAAGLRKMYIELEEKICHDKRP